MGAPQSVQLLLVLGLGIAIRWALFHYGFTSALNASYEVTTPVSSFERLQEGAWLSKHGDGAYTGSSYHNVPLFLALLEHSYSFSLPSETVLRIGAISIDVICAILLFLLPAAYKGTFSYEWSMINIIDQYRRHHAGKLKPQGAVSLEASQKVLDLSPRPSLRLPIVLASIYMLSPFSIACCVALSTQLVLNLTVIATALFACFGSIFLASLTLGLSIYLSPYMLVLVLPTAMIVGSRSRVAILKGAILVVLTIAVFLASLVVSYLYMGGDLDRVLQLEGNPAWIFLDRVYGFQFFVEDLQPNIGVSWYFHMEVFQHFRLLFLFVFQYHVFIYTIPFCYKFADHPMAVFWMLLVIASAFKSYPSVADVVLYTSLFPILNHLMDQMTYKTLIGTAALVETFLLPLMWRMWIWTGTGNANFYFAICVGVAATNGLLVTDAMESILKRNFLIKKAIAKDLLLQPEENKAEPDAPTPKP